MFCCPVSAPVPAFTYGESNSTILSYCRRCSAMLASDASDCASAASFAASPDFLAPYTEAPTATAPTAAIPISISQPQAMNGFDWLIPAPIKHPGCGKMVFRIGNQPLNTAALEFGLNKIKKDLSGCRAPIIRLQREDVLNARQACRVVKAWRNESNEITNQRTSITQRYKEQRAIALTLC